MRMSIGALQDLFFRRHQMNRLADGVHFYSKVDGMSTCLLDNQAFETQNKSPCDLSSLRVVRDNLPLAH